jgi:hypothetical protein
MASCARLLLLAIPFVVASSTVRAARPTEPPADLGMAWARLSGDPSAAERLGPALVDLDAALQGLAPDQDPARIAERLLRDTLLSRGADPDAVDRLVPGLVGTLRPRPDAAANPRGLGGPNVPVAIGPFELTRETILRIVGPRSGRSRLAVVEALHHEDPVAADSLADDELVALVPRLVALAEDRVLVPPLLALRFRTALDAPGSFQ